MNIAELFDMDLFRQMQQEGMISVRQHEGHPLSIANYTDQAQYKNHWNDVTLNCRGLIYEQLTGNVIARPWKKFFNLGDSKAPWIGFDDLAEVTDKMDGSLGILYYYNGKPSISTRGSFHSTQAGWATREIRRMNALPLTDEHDLGLKLFNTEHYTFLFEIIYPTNRIVVDYGKFEGLVLLGLVENHTGYVYGPQFAAMALNWPGLTTEVMPLKSISDVLAASDRENTEGYVIRAGNKMVKWKRPDYINLHRLISSLSERSVWSGLEGGKTVEELIEGLPDEFHGFVRDTSAKLTKAFEERKHEINALYLGKRLLVGATLAVDASEREKRKHFALAIKDHKDKAYFFALADKKDISSMIWQELKPSGDSVPNDPR